MNLYPFAAVIKRELWSVMRDFTIVISIVIQAFIASFSSAMLLGMLSLYDADMIMGFRGSSIQVGMVAPAGHALQGYLNEYGIKTLNYGSLEEAQTAYFSRQVSAIFVVPEDPNREVKLYLPNADTLSSLIRMIVQEPLKRYENSLRKQNGVDIRYTNLRGKPTTRFEFMYSVLIPLLMFFPAFVSGSMVVDSLTEEVENNTLQTLLSSPISINGILFAKIAAAMLLAVAQCIAWLALLQTNGVVIQNVGWIILLALIMAGLTSTASALGAALLRDRERSQFIYSLILLAATSLGTLLDISPIKTIARLSIGDVYTNGWNVAVFGLFFAGLCVILARTSHRLTR